jgi:16S rRNA (adenine1518-N6/adenine1519-N6)-dimethyltransferase
MRLLPALKKRFGQHFLTDRSTLRRIVEFARIEPADTVLEVGPGPGNLTAELAAVARRVIAIEIDRDLIPALRARMPANVEIIEGDALAVEWPRDTVRVVGNLPYNVATPLIKRFIENRARIRDITVMVQKEVAERMTAPPSTREYGPLSVFIQYYATVTYGFTVSPGAFRPQPQVDSAVIRLAWKPDVAEAPTFTDFVQRAFTSRRKKLVNNLLAMFPALARQDVARRLADAGIDVDSRPEQLSVTEFLRVYNQFPLSSGQ